MRTEHSLTDKQKETLNFLAQGYSSKQIAAHFDISPQAVDRRIQGLLRKTGCSDRGELVRWQQQHGGLSSARETNLGNQPETPAISVSEHFTANVDHIEAGWSPRATIRCAMNLDPELTPSSAGARSRIEWLGAEVASFRVTWLQVILALILLREIYEIVA